MNSIVVVKRRLNVSQDAPTEAVTLHTLQVVQRRAQYPAVGTEVGRLVGNCDNLCEDYVIKNARQLALKVFGELFVVYMKHTNAPPAIFFLVEILNTRGVRVVPLKPSIVDRPEVAWAFLKEAMRVKSAFPLLPVVTGRDNTYSGNERKRLQMSVAALIIKRFPLRS
ncbi:hypothetical protein CEXT_309731 [Caerostris extrusa]|uniref:Uncharacterized protein n=1 Tax=Caerostris extrusa TaxID=172846 RepID=A0AAV4NF62_CAEEX|nr:hypothetical protein CEXT_309731 [Caerostris extrusa]